MLIAQEPESALSLVAVPEACGLILFALARSHYSEIAHNEFLKTVIQISKEQEEQKVHRGLLAAHEIVLFDRFNANLQESLAVLLMGLTIAFAPFATSFYSYQFLMATECFCQGYLYSAIPGQIYELWDASKFKGSILQGCYSRQTSLVQIRS